MEDLIDNTELLVFEARHGRLTTGRRPRRDAAAPDFDFNRVADLAIAATADNCDLTVLTRHLRHFAPFEIRTINPFETLPA